MPDFRAQLYWSIPLSAVLLLAAKPAWQDKSIQNWTEEDARQILTDSPWSKIVVGMISRLQSEDERRDGGNMGQDHGVGFDGIDGKKTRPKLPASIFSKPVADATLTAHPATVTLRWESAFPIRAAELKARVIEPPTLAGDGYSIAVYGVRGIYFNRDPKTLGDPLKNQAVLKRVGKKDVKPSSVEVFQQEDGLVIVYLFPLSAEIMRKDRRIQFDAKIGRLAIAEYFDIEEMLFQGKLEL